MKTIRLHPGKEKSLLRRHPWIFESAVAKGGADSGETVRVESAQGNFLAWGAFSPASRIRVRAWSFKESERIDADFLAHRVAAAIQARSRFDWAGNGCRLIQGEADGLPGLVVDRYAEVLVVQFLACGVERFKAALLQALHKHTGVTSVYERSDTHSRELEGLPPATGWLSKPGDPAASAPSTELVLQEHHWQLHLDIARGHKTGFYLDQRDSRLRFSNYAQRLRFQRVLNGYCYSGGFTVAALHGLRAAGVAEGESEGGAEVTSIDSSAPALEAARANLRLNGFDPSQHHFLDADVNASLRTFVAEGRSFDAIVLDPPKLAPTAAHAERAARAYKDINRLAFKLLAPGGVLFTFSCSGGISADLFHKIVASAGLDAGVDGYFLERLGAAPDHPMTIEFPEGEYLKGWVVMRR